MLKKSLLLSIAVLLTAVIFIFTGCEGPAGPAGQNAENGDINFPDSITVSVPSGGGGGTTELPPSLPPGVTYPEKGAKILSGNAADISKAFNGGVFVANTPDSGTLGGSNTGGETYAQDAVDAVVWTGVGDSLGASYQGSIVVPPGKTLFIAAPLTIDSGSLFQGITIADEAAYTQSAPYNPSILQATKGGTSIEEGAPGGKVIILNGGSITGSGGGGPLTIGGYLEIHRGGSISVGVATLSSTYGSVINNYGLINAATGTSARLVIEGDLTVKGGGSVIGSPTSVSSVGDIFRGKITVEGYATFTSGNPGSSYPVNYYGAVDVKEKGTFALSATANNPIFFHALAEIAGTLYAFDNDIRVPNTGHLKITSTGTILASGWGQINGGTDISLLEAIKSGALPSAENNYTTMAVSSEAPIVLDFSTLAVSTYDNLRAFAASEFLSFPGGISLTRGVTDATKFTTEEADLLVTQNNVELNNYTEIGNVEVSKDKSLTIIGSVDTAGAIVIHGGLTASNATFAVKLDSLTIGDPAALKADEGVSVSLGAATFATTASPVITVNPYSSLTLSSNNVDPGGTIDLKSYASLNITGSGTTDLHRLEKLFIDTEAVLTNSGSSTIDFYTLEELKVKGELLVNTVDYPFWTLHDQDRGEAGKAHVDGADNGGIALFNGWQVVSTGGNARHYAFDQLLAIKDLTVTSVTGVPSTSGTGNTPDADSPESGAILRVLTGITAPDGGLTIDRDLNVLNGAVINFGADENTVTIKNGSKILVGTATLTAPASPGLSAGGSADAVLVANGVSTLTETSGALVGGAADINVDLGSTLNVDGKLTAGASGTGAILAGLGTGLITLADSSLKNGSITSNTDTVTPAVNATGDITVKSGGLLSIGGTDSVVLKGSSIKLNDGGAVETAGSATLSFDTVGKGLTLQGDSALLAVASSSASLVTITAGNTDTGDATISGTLIVTDGTLAALATGTTNVLSITANSSVSSREANLNYNSVAIAGASTITGAVVFNADSSDPAIELTGTLSGGTLSTKRAGGSLKLGATGIKLTATGANGQSLTDVTLDGTAVAVYGSGTLKLTTGTTLTIPSGASSSPIFTVGKGTATLTAGTLAVDGGTISLGYVSSNSGLLKLLDDTSLGTLILGGTASISNVLAGQNSSNSGGANFASVGTAGDGSIYGNNDLTMSGVTGTTGTGTAGTSAVVTLASGIITITPTAGGNTITSSSRLVQLP